MNEALLLRMAELFALLAAKRRAAVDTGAVFVEFAHRCDLDDEQAEEYLGHYQRLYRQYSSDAALLQNLGADDSAFFGEKLSEAAALINGECEEGQKMWLCLQCLEFAGECGIADDGEAALVDALAALLQVNAEDYLCLRRFTLEQEQSLPLGSNLLLIARENHLAGRAINFLHNEKILGRIYILYLKSADTLLLRYFGQRALFFNSRMLRVGGVYIFGVGGVIRNQHISPVYYNDVINIFLQKGSDFNINYEAQNISYRFPMSKNGVHPFSFRARAGELVAIMGGSGVGKSTLLNLLSGQLKPRGGRVLVNGHDVRRERDLVESVIGCVPQDDLLMEELSVYDNLYYNARLCFSDFSDREAREEAMKVLEQFDLVEAAHLKVGSPLKKSISGGQRKRLNIAMEIMRQPAVLFLDEPTSGLSSVDSERIMLLLKRLTLGGKLIFINIHQPSSDLYKLFNSVIILDQGGHVIFVGNPMDGVVYFKEAAHYLNAGESECAACGNINTELILRVVEARSVDEFGRLTARRRRSPAQWYSRYLARIQGHFRKEESEMMALPESLFHKPSAWKQLVIFFMRNLKAKMANRQYLLLTLLGAPLLALVLAYFTKFSAGTESDASAYVFSENSNIPAYLFISVIAVFFFGLSASAQEIIKDRRALQRERLLHLSRNAYLLSKAAWLLIVSAYQAAAFVLIGNGIQEIAGMGAEYGAVLFSVSVCAGLLGLNLSAGLNSDASIYIFIPLILIPQILFGGVVIEYEKLQRQRGAPDYVPLAAQMTPSRWAYEALAVAQFRGNAYERLFVKYDEQMSRLTYEANLWIPQLEMAVSAVQRGLSDGGSDDYYAGRRELLYNELPLVVEKARRYGLDLTNVSKKLGLVKVEEGDLVEIRIGLDSLRRSIQRDYRRIARDKDDYTRVLIGKYGGSGGALALQKAHHNKALADMVLGKGDNDKIRESGGRLVQAKDPVFKEARSRWGQAHFYASRKRLGSWEVETLWFNVGALWLMNVALYLALSLNVLRRGVQQINRFRAGRRGRHLVVGW